MNYRKFLATAAIATTAISTISAQCSSGSCSDASCGSSKEETPKTVEAKTPEAPADAIVATVNGENVMQSQVDRIIMAQMAQYMGGQQVPPEQMKMISQQMSSRVIEALVDTLLIDQAVTEAKLTATTAEISAFLEKQLTEMVKGSGMTIDQYKEMLEQRTGKKFAEVLEAEAKNPEQKKSFLQMQYIKKQSPEALEVTTEDIKKFYTDNKEQFNEPAQVQASHILVKFAEDATDEDKAKAKAEITDIQKKVKDGGDFAELAKSHSACPSKAQGGDLGKFGKGAMVPEFEKAAFSMKVDDVSDIVETQFGYHLIKKTADFPGRVVPLEEVQDRIGTQLKFTKLQDAQKTLADTLRKTAKISFPNKK